MRKRKAAGLELSPFGTPSLLIWMRPERLHDARRGEAILRNRGSLPKLLRPVDGVDVDAEGVLAQPIGIARRLDHDAENGSPALG